jgi:hypothetical protein
MFWNLKGHAMAFRVVKTLFYFLHIYLEIVLDGIIIISIIIIIIKRHIGA